MANFSFIQSADSDTDPASATFGATPTEGNLLIAVAMDRSGGDAANYTISGSGWTKEISITPSTDATYRRTFVVWWKVAGASEPTNVQVDDGTANSKRLLTAEYQSDTAGTWTFEDSTSGHSGDTAGPTTQSSGSTASISAGDLLLIGAFGVKVNDTSISTTFTWSSSDLTQDAAIGGTAYSRTLAVAHLKETSSGAKSTTVGCSAQNVGIATGLLVFSFGAGGGGGSGWRAAFAAQSNQSIG